MTAIPPGGHDGASRGKVRMKSGSVNLAAQQLLKEGVACFFAERLEEARSSLQAAREVDPGDANIARWLAEVDWRLKLWPSAMEYCQIALSLDPTVCRRFYDDFGIDARLLDDSRVGPPVFIVGCGHSGTSLLLAILGQHSKLHAVPYESALFTRSDSEVSGLMSEWDDICARTSKTSWIEKTPLHVLQVGRWLKFRPDARFILMVRDGRDVIASLKRRVEWQDIERRINRWVFDNTAGMQHADDPSCLIIKYEDLIVDPEGYVREICRFINLEYEDGLLEFHRTERNWYSENIVKPHGRKTHESHDEHLNLRNWQINQPIFDGRGIWRDVLDESEIESVKNSPAQLLLEHYGYVEGQGWK